MDLVPGVERVGLVSSFPLGGGSFPNGRFIEMTRPDEFASFDDIRKLGDAAKARFGMADYRIASEDYFAAMGIPLIRGRPRGQRRPGRAARRASSASRWRKRGGRSRTPSAASCSIGNMDGDLRGFRIVGIVGDVREISPETVPGPIFYGYYQQRAHVARQRRRQEPRPRRR